MAVRFYSFLFLGFAVCFFYFLFLRVFLFVCCVVPQFFFFPFFCVKFQGACKEDHTRPGSARHQRRLCGMCACMCGGHGGGCCFHRQLAIKGMLLRNEKETKREIERETERERERERKEKLSVAATFTFHSPSLPTHFALLWRLCVASPHSPSSPPFLSLHTTPWCLLFSSASWPRFCWASPCPFYCADQHQLHTTCQGNSSHSAYRPRTSGFLLPFLVQRLHHNTRL